MMKRFDKLLEIEVSEYKGEFEDIIKQAPAFYRLMTRLLDDPDLPRDLSQMVIAAIAYFILPEDAIPEDKYGPMGFIDDIYLCAFVADKVMQAAGKEEILVRNWDGQVPVVPLVKGILAREKELLGDKKERIMELIGYGQENEL
jgi:uncharacterized membrane protein YkvA (DUF1232 family)